MSNYLSPSKPSRCGTASRSSAHPSMDAGSTWLRLRSTSWRALAWGGAWTTSRPYEARSQLGRHAVTTYMPESTGSSRPRTPAQSPIASTRQLFHDGTVETLVEKFRSSLLCWDAYFGLAQTTKVWRELEEWLRHRLRAIPNCSTASRPLRILVDWGCQGCRNLKLTNHPVRMDTRAGLLR